MTCTCFRKPGLPTLFLALTFAALADDLSIDHNAGPARLGITGEVGRHFILQSTTNPGDPNSWLPVLTLPLTNNLQSWFDADSLTLGQRFYRTVKLEAEPDPVVARNFRLIDHQGNSRELYYYSTSRAIVLIFTGNDCANVQQLSSTIENLRTSYTSQGVLFWMIDANQGDNRSNILAQATALKINLPILHDEAQIVARDFGAAATPEAVCVNTADWSIFYRGAIDDRVGADPAATTQNYLASA
ncbi:MAG TPA: redoxin domain-containing protein, partial [Candidatus Eisenbacteria bacterium]|nr:redoxin domain-containing protein [Candidatus Eisenbacteria bacterium]